MFTVSGMPPSLDPFRHLELGLAPLVSAVGELLAAIAPELGDDRVSSRPDARTLRYYQSLGILDRPLRHDGREAVYGYRHLLQAVATKLLQSEGLSLGQIQRALAGRTTDVLEAAVVEALAGASVVTARMSSSWGGGGSPPATPPPSPPVDSGAAPARALVTREVAPGVLVTVDPRLVPDPESTFSKITALFYPHPYGGSR